MGKNNHVGSVIGGGPSTYGYHHAPGRVVLVNHALALAPLFPAADFVTLHPEVFGKRSELRRYGVTPVVGEWGAHYLPEGVRAKTHLFRGVQIELDDLRPSHVIDAGPPEIIHAACSAQVAIHWAWQQGVRELHVIGCHEYHGRPAAGYDPRLRAEAVYFPNEAAAVWYIECVRRYIPLFPWVRVCWEGY